MRITLLCVLSLTCLARAESPTTAPSDEVVIAGLSAGPFDPSLWSKGTLHFLPDVRSPMIDPKAGPFRNIYAPSAVELPDHTYRLFYGGWDGSPTGNDRVYSADTPDFISFSNRHLVIDHGPFEHVNNVSAVRLNDGTFTLMCTAYPVGANKLNQPVLFHLTDSKPITASESDLIHLTGYDNFPTADINGLNPILLNPDGKSANLYFADFHHFGDVFLATPDPADAKHYSFQGAALHFAAAPNDVKQIGKTTLMALHMNGPKLWYSLSDNGTSFSTPLPLGSSTSAADRYITAVCFVTQRDSVMGYLYGAGAVGSLDHNRLFASWLQRKVIFFTDDGRELSPTHSMGPDRAILPLTQSTRGKLKLLAEDGVTPIRTSGEITLTPGKSLVVPR